jgi:hypothetical protein
MVLYWPEFTIPSINLWVMPSLTYIDYTEKHIKGKKVYSMVVKDNPLYKLRSEEG